MLSRFSGTREQQVAQASTSEEVTNPLEKLRKPNLNPQQEMASRVLARRRLLPFVQRTNERYEAGWVHADICMRLEKFSDDVARGLSPRLMLLMPPRHGKSELASKNFPAWHLGRHPDHEFIACSYNLSLAMGFSRKVKQIMEDSSYAGVFPNTKLDPNNQSTEEWGIANERGGYVAAGIGGPITGKGATCLPGPTLVSTSNGNLTLETLYQLKSLPEVVTPLGPRRVLAITKRPAPVLYELRFASGEVLQATGTHPIYLPDRAAYVSVEKLHGEAEGDGRLDLRVVREGVSTATVQPRQVGEARVDGVLLQPRVQPGAPLDEEREAVCHVLGAAEAVGTDRQRDVLLDRVPAEGCPDAADLPSVQRGVSADVFKAGLLRGELRQYGAHDPYAWGGELELSDGQRIRVLVRPDEAADLVARQGVCGVLDGCALVGASHRRGSEQQRSDEPRHALLDAPRGAPQVHYDTLSVVARLGQGTDFVYDLQVEDAGCFFAEGVLVGNCLVIDDPVKNAEEADSGDAREKIWEWYLSTAYSRLAPGGGVLIIQTWWHDDDLAGRIQQMMAENPDDEDIDQFEVVKYPAIATQDEYLDPTTLEIVYEPTPNASLLRSKGDALHPARYDIKKLNKIRALNRKDDGSDGRWWSALYQQNPVPDDGSYFTKDQFRRGALPPIKRSNVCIAWDFAISEKKQNDYTVGTVLLQDENDVLHVAEVVRFRSGDAAFIVESILGLSAKWASPTQVIGFEDGQIFRALQTLLAKRMREKKMYPSTETLKPITDKMARARAIQGRMQQGMVSFNEKADWYDTVRGEMLRFPAGVHDDCVDSLAWATILAVGKEPPRKEPQQKLKSWKDKLLGAKTGLSHMAA